MSEIDLIRKLEALKQVKPNKEWVGFTKESILSGEGTVEKKPGFNIWLRQLTPLTICVCLAMTFGFIYTVNMQGQDPEMAEVEEPQNNEPINLAASIIETIELDQEDLAEVPIIETETVEEITYSDIIKNIGSDSDAVMKEIERIRQEVAACEAQIEYLNEEQKETCENMKKQLEIIDKFTEE